MPEFEGEILGCDDGSCLLVLVSQTLDDRLEIFAPRDPEGQMYRGAIGLDLVPNECPGCGLGDNGEGRLDEPFGLALTPAGLHVVTGHYPTPELGSLLTFPREWFAERPAGELVPESEFFAGGAFSGIEALSLEQLEPIFVRPVGGKLVIGTFNNSLIAPEETWSRPGRLLIVDPMDSWSFVESFNSFAMRPGMSSPPQLDWLKCARDPIAIGNRTRCRTLYQNRPLAGAEMESCSGCV